MNLDIRAPQRATMTILDGEESRGCWPADILSVSGRVMVLSCGVRAEMSTGIPVRIEWPDYMVLGEIVERPSADAVAVQIRHAVHTPEIEALRQKWL